MTAPSTREELARAIRDAGSYGLPITDYWYVLADAIMEWRAEWLRDAEPRLRPVSEKPRDGDRIALHYDRQGWTLTRPWDASMQFFPGADGWILLERAKPKTLAEEARELLATAGGAPQSNIWAAKAEAFMRRVAEQEKCDE